MALATVYSRALDGFSAPLVSVEVHLANGLPGLAIVGLPAAAVREARHRVRAALTHCGFDFPARHITVNLAPADLPKESGRFDLPIALGILIASGQVAAPRLSHYEFAGELALDGLLRPVRGALAMTWRARGSGRAFVLPLPNAAEAARAQDVTVHGATDLRAVCAHLAGQASLPIAIPPCDDGVLAHQPDLADVRGQPQAARALEIAAAGGHSLLMSGPPGVGKSMLAERLPGLLPPLEASEALEQAALRSLDPTLRGPGNADGGPVATPWGERPFRAPHHSASSAALVGGGARPQPGEISLAHHGVLFLDELPEFDRRALDALREPLETGRIALSRAGARADYPARVQLVAAMNPCPCGYRGASDQRCRCSPEQVARYRSKLSGPLLDRIDLHVEVPPVAPEALLGKTPTETSATVRSRVLVARRRALHRQGCCNALLSGHAIERWCQPASDAQPLLNDAVRRFGLSARALHRVMRVSRTIADLAGAQMPQLAHVAEALRHRPVELAPARYDRGPTSDT